MSDTEFDPLLAHQALLEEERNTRFAVNAGARDARTIRRELGWLLFWVALQMLIAAWCFLRKP